LTVKRGTRVEAAAAIYDSTDNQYLNEQKLRTITSGLQNRYSIVFTKMLRQNAIALADFLSNASTEINLSDKHKMNIIDVLNSLSNRFESKKSFRNMRREDILSFLDSVRKSEISDPQHKWIGTYNLYRVLIVKFFKWLYYPEMQPSKRPKPSLVENIPQLKRKEKSIYKPTDLWSAEDDLLFVKYCPSKRIKCYHMVSRDLSCRPHELLKLKVKDVFFKSTGGYQYAEVLLNGKTGTRPIPLINSIPYLKDYLDHEHPQPSNPNAPLICGTGKSWGRRIQTNSLTQIYSAYKKEIFPRLLKSPNVSPEDKQKITELLKKPWNPYIRRHSALTEKSTILKEHVLRQHAGWSVGSQMPQIYLHYFGNESSESLLEAYGIVAKSQQQLDQLRSKQCPNCNEPNKPDSKFCAKCRMVLTYDAYGETVEDKQQKDDALATLSDQVMKLMKDLDELKQGITNNIPKSNS
jgi:integrase/recombinase XerD